MKQQAITNANQQIEKYRQSIELIDMLPGGPFEFLVNYSIQLDTIHVRIPFDKAAFKVWRRALGSGWRCNDWSTTDHGSHISKCRCYWPSDRTRYDGPVVLLTLDTAINGSTCHLEQIGVREEPVFEVVCS